MSAGKPVALKLVINCVTVDFLAECLRSVVSQSFENWEAFVTLDGPADAARFGAIRAQGHPRISFTQNQTRRYSLPNQMSAIAQSGDDQEDVIVSLDGDDWLARPDALQIIADTYRRSGCWMTYGSWFSKPGGRDGTGMWPAYPEGTTDFRNTRWLGTAVRTWKRWLWGRIADADLCDDDGEYLRIAEDRAIMLPLLEMCGTSRAKHIAEPLMEYNQQAANYSPSEMEETARNVEAVRARKPYARIE